jgi:hypothetical protein
MVFFGSMRDYKGGMAEVVSLLEANNEVENVLF